jgi:hypothetical protein
MNVASFDDSFHPQRWYDVRSPMLKPRALMPRMTLLFVDAL